MTTAPTQFDGVIPELMEKYLPLTQVFKHLKMETADSTIVEYDRMRYGEMVRATALVKYAGAIFTDDDDNALDQAVLRLLLAVDDAIVYGDGGQGHGLHGLFDMARPRGAFGEPQESRRLSPPSSTSGLIQILPRKEFYTQATDRGMKIISKMPVGFMDEGSLPPDQRVGPRTFAFVPDAIEWHQLLPLSVVPLVSMREGLGITPLLEEKFERDASVTVNRKVVLLYGTIVIRNAADVILLEAR